MDSEPDACICLTATSSPLSTVVSMLPHLLLPEPDLAPVSLSRPVVQRLRWVAPQTDQDASYIYFNNMAGHGNGSRTEELRMSLALLGPSSWRVCAEEEVQYKTDFRSPNIDYHQLLDAEVFCRVTIWNGEATTNRSTRAEEKLAVILKLEPTGETNSNLPNIGWAYFDLQDLVTPGLDRRPWFSSLEGAIKANSSAVASPKTKPQRSTSRNPQDRTGDSSSENAGDYWAGVSSSEESNSQRGRALLPPCPNTLSPEIRGTDRGASFSPAKLHRGPPVPHHSTRSEVSRREDGFEVNPTKPSQTVPLGSITAEPLMDVEALLEAAGVANLPPELRQAAERAFAHTNAPNHGFNEANSVSPVHCGSIATDSLSSPTSRRLEATLPRASKPPLESLDASMNADFGESFARGRERHARLTQCPMTSSGPKDSPLTDNLSQHLEASLRGLYLMYHHSLKAGPQFAAHSPAQVDSIIRGNFVQLAQKVVETIE